MGGWPSSLLSALQPERLPQLCWFCKAGHHGPRLLRSSHSFFRTFNCTFSSSFTSTIPWSALVSFSIVYFPQPIVTPNLVPQI
jgi:hypothetical protein